MTLILGIDIGGTGSRAALGDVGDATDHRGNAVSRPGIADGGGFVPRIIDQLTGPRIEIGPSGSNVLLVVRELVRTAAETWPERFPEVSGIGIGATGIASLAEDPSDVLGEISGEVGVPAVAAIDAVTAHLGALGGAGGAISVLGTGAIAIAHPGPDADGKWSADWSRADGWGHLFGDRGGGAWLGRHGLELALRTHDGIDGRGRVLLEAATRRFGPPASWPGQFYTRSDRAGVLAEFAADIADAARADDTVAIDLLREAGQEAARSALAAARSVRTDTDSSTVATEALPASNSATRIALTGGVAAAGDHLVEGFRAEAARLDPTITIVEPAGGPLDGALTLGHLGASGTLDAQDKVLWT
ncbi:BadF-type ATPase [Brevibacterium iodinum ATCC 49514]|uniref:BadF-type ATPase n=1 Tax=Brevibacterium iodinum ATCC 49514 TaxID=1255616 RepID=A0A2H1HW96_9MICO|nr:BadF/BadG/BcrA/BcrD ATPase family protein [Brevibacterium iodinum]SMX67215.1 BadF-type ATPase [Brevibacterium iodinum ATCC 49514]SUW13696.1 BadF/BadG/BcrA/BcrD ATPase family [Brevibacterium iodinum]